jgi:hypothetical protein
MLLHGDCRLLSAAVGKAYIYLRGPHPAAINRGDLDGDVREAQTAGKRS